MRVRLAKEEKVIQRIYEGQVTSQRINEGEVSKGSTFNGSMRVRLPANGLMRLRLGVRWDDVRGILRVPRIVEGMPSRGAETCGR